MKLHSTALKSKMTRKLFLISSLIGINFSLFSLNAQISNQQLITPENGIPGKSINQKSGSFYKKLYTTNTDSQIPVAKKVIIEFKGETLSDVYKMHNTDKDRLLLKTSQKSLFSSFRTDVKKMFSENQKAQATNKSGAVRAYSIEPEFGQQYTKLFSGQAITVDSLMIAEIKQLPYVKAVHIDRIVISNLVESIPLIGADSVWNELDCEGDSIRVGIIDTGIDYNHPALGGGFGPGHKVIGGYDFVNLDNDPMDDNSHGTHVAGIIASNNESIRGVAPKALLYALKVLDIGGSGFESDILSAIEYTVDPNGDDNFSDKLDVVNMSLGAPKSEANDPMENAISNAIELGVVYCISAGNSGPDFGTIGSPGTTLAAITVGAIDKEFSIADFSSRGPTSYTNYTKPDIMAPGVNILSTIPKGEFESMSGTSMASPLVAGVCALLKKLHPEWTPGDIKSAILSTATDLNKNALHQGSGVVNAYKAAQVSTLIEPANINFGTYPATDSNSVWTKNRNLKIRNTSKITQNYVLVPDTSISGISFNFDNTAFSLESNEEKIVSVTIYVDNNQLPVSSSRYFKDLDSYSGLITIKSSELNQTISWTYFMPDIKIQSDRPIWALWYWGENSIGIVPVMAVDLRPEYLKAFLPKTGYLMAEFADSIYSTVFQQYFYFPHRILIKKLNLSSSDTVLTLNSDEAKNKITYSTRDENGNLYTDNLTKQGLIAIWLNDSINYSFRWAFDNHYKNDAIFYSGGVNPNEMEDISFSEELVVTTTVDSTSWRTLDTIYISDIPEEMKVLAAETRRMRSDTTVPRWSFLMVSLGNSAQVPKTSTKLNPKQQSFQSGDITFCFNSSESLNGLSSDLFVGCESGKYNLIHLNTPTQKTFRDWGPKIYLNEPKFFSSNLYEVIEKQNFKVYMPSKESEDVNYFSFFALQSVPSLAPEDLFISLAPRISCVNNKFMFGLRSSPEKKRFEPNDTLSYEPGTHYGVINSWFQQNRIFIDVKKMSPSYESFFPKVGSPIASMYYSNGDWFQDIWTRPHDYFVPFTFRDIPIDKYSIKLTSEPFKVYSKNATFTAKLDFDLRKSDGISPTLTSLHVSDQNEKSYKSIPKGDTAYISFSVADFNLTDFDKKNYISVESDSTQLLIRENSTNTWTVIETDSVLEDSFIGILYKAQFTNTNYDSVYMDLKIRGVDTLGNSFEQTISPAFFIRNIQPPVAVNDEYVANFNKILISGKSVTANDINPFGSNSELEIVMLDSVKHGSFEFLPNGNFKYTCTDNVDEDSFTYKVKNERYESETAVAHISIKYPNSIQEIGIANNQRLLIYPNPAIDNLNFILNSDISEEVSIELYDLSGQKRAHIYSGILTSGENRLSWNLSDQNGNKIPAGMFILQFQSESETSVFKLIIE